MIDEVLPVFVFLTILILMLGSVVLIVNGQHKSPFVWPSKEERRIRRQAQTPKQKILIYVLIVAFGACLIANYFLSGRPDPIMYVFKSLLPIAVIVVIRILASHSPRT